MKKASCCSMFTALLLMVMQCSVSNHDWTQWRGPQGSGLSQETDWNPKALNNDSVLWRSNVGDGHSSVAVQGDRLYTMGEYVKEAAGDTTCESALYCLNARTGEEIWRFAYPSKRGNFPGPGATPVVRGRQVYALSRAGSIMSVDAVTGRLIWQRNLVADSLGLLPVGPEGFNASPLVSGNRLIVNTGENGLCLDRHDGRVLWRSKTAMGGQATPVIFSYQGQDRVMMPGKKKFSVLDLESGRLIWSREWHGYLDPRFLNGSILLMNRDGMLRLSPEGREEPIEQPLKDLKMRSFINALIVDNYFYGFCRSGRTQPLQCVNLSDGSVQWKAELGDWGSLIGAGGQLIIVTGQGRLIIANAGQQAFEIQSQVDLFGYKPWKEYGPDEMTCCWTNPVLAKGCIYVRSNRGHLVCVDVKQPRS